MNMNAQLDWKTLKLVVRSYWIYVCEYVPCMLNSPNNLNLKVSLNWFFFYFFRVTWKTIKWRINIQISLFLFQKWFYTVNKYLYMHPIFYSTRQKGLFKWNGTESEWKAQKRETRKKWQVTVSISCHISSTKLKAIIVYWDFEFNLR